jgi:hypothetical protein
LLAVEAAERLIQDHQPYLWPHERTPEPHSLPFPARQQTSPLAEGRLESIGKFF